jgi:RimJ/RimL family protein N-acetyltransferase
LSSVSLRPASSVDAGCLHAWRNEAETRAASFDTSPIAWEEHVRWLDAKLANPRARVMIATDESGEEVGVVRLDASGDAAEISVSIDHRHRGHGIGTAVIRAGAALAMTELGARRVIARIRPENARSLRAFAGAGFARSGEPRNDVVELVFVDRRSASLAPEARETGRGSRRRHE